MQEFIQDVKPVDKSGEGLTGEIAGPVTNTRFGAISVQAAPAGRINFVK